MANKNKTISVTAKTVMVNYTDTNKHFVYHIEKNSPTRDVVLFGKKLNVDTKKDFLSPKERSILEDILYSKRKYTQEEIKSLPLIRQYYITDVARKAEFVLEKWRRELAEKRFNGFLNKVFFNSKLVKQITETDSECNLFPDVKLRDLANEQEIVNFLKTKGLFPTL